MGSEQANGRGGSTDDAFDDVLVIDDSDIARETMIRLLERAGLRAHGIPSPIGASRMLARRRARVVVVDINLPGMRGEKLAQIFRENRRLRSLSVVLTSSLDLTELQILAEACGADAVVPKSSGFAELVPVVRSLLERSDASTA